MYFQRRMIFPFQFEFVNLPRWFIFFNRPAAFVPSFRVSRFNSSDSETANLQRQVTRRLPASFLTFQNSLTLERIFFVLLLDLNARPNQQIGTSFSNDKRLHHTNWF